MATKGPECRAATDGWRRSVGSDPDREHALGAEFDGYITKPIDIRTFPELVHRALAGEMTA